MHMHVCVYVCVFVYMCVCVLYVCVYACVCVCSYMYMYDSYSFVCYLLFIQQYCSWLLTSVIMTTFIIPCLLVSAANGWTKDDTNLYTISSCVLSNTSQLHYYCGTHNHDQQSENSQITVNLNDLNTIKISEKLCGKYNNQGTCIAIFLATGLYHIIAS